MLSRVSALWFVQHWTSMNTPAAAAGSGVHRVSRLLVSCYVGQAGTQGQRECQLKQYWVAPCSDCSWTMRMTGCSNRITKARNSLKE